MFYASKRVLNNLKPEKKARTDNPMGLETTLL